MNSYNRVYATVDLGAMESDMRAMKDSLSPTTSMIGVAKTGRYGYGAALVARTIDPYMEGYAVVAIDEAVILRRHGIQEMTLVLGVTHESRLRDLVRYDIRPATLRYEEAGRLSETAVENGVRANTHLAVDTDMSRIGMTPNEASTDKAARVARLPGIRIEGMFTHLARADEADKEFYKTQYKECRNFCEVLHSKDMDILIHHCSSNAGIVEGLDPNGLDMVHTGISIHGLYPSDKVVQDRVKLVPTMESKSIITYIRTIESGTSVSCDGTSVVGHPARAAAIPVGYGDDYPRSSSNKGAALIRGKRVEILGRMCMDQFVVGVTDIPGAAEGDRVTLVRKDGEECITAEELARVGGGFHYEIICGVGKRVPGVYLRDGKTIGQKDYPNDIYESFGHM